MRVQLPDLATVRPAAPIITLAALVMIVRLRWSVLRALGLCAAFGLATAAVTSVW
ncbi:hypothetical protein [Streptomyces sp. NPDC051572]|uniref:hypothetical protein n=1 Tax=Streptomyces sp. NPDC051572 TaxID=3155802 RepID=UPI00344EE2D1